jgi:septal ring factor EnvC (AmiA/AmiB activator)
MNVRWPHSRRPAAVTTVAVAGALVALAAAPLTSNAQPSLGELNSELGQQQGHQQQLEAGLGGLSRLIGSLSGQIALVQSREAAVQSQLAQDRAQLVVAQAALSREESVLSVLRARLAQSRALLARQLVSNYESDNPDLVTVVLESSGFRDLLERVTYLGDAERQQQMIITITRAARTRADAATRRLSRLEATDRQITQDAAVRSQALAGMNSLLRSKQAVLSRAQSIQRAALSASQARSGRLQAEISQIEAEQAAQRAAAAQAAAAQAAAAQSAATQSASPSAPQSAATQSASPSTPVSSGPALGPSGGWAIPYPIVLCESGGQNLPPNSAGASGYYQIMAATWRLFGGSGPAAYLASKAEQDAVASRIWAGGAGASNWVCAAMVGIH